MYIWTRKPVEGSDHCFNYQKKKKEGNWKADAMQTFGLGPALSQGHLSNCQEKEDPITLVTIS
jgi:hypothetical protein